MEGNPLHPLSQGSSDNHAQASILDLYDPARRQHLTRNGKKATASEWEEEINRIRAESLSTSGSSLAILADEQLSPTRERLRGELQRQFPQSTWATYEPLSPGRDLEASALVFGDNTEFRPNLSAATAILSVDCDFLGSEEGDLNDTRGFASGRRTRKPSDPTNRLYVVEPRFSLTGTMADHRLRLRPSAIGAFLLELARQIRAAKPGAELNTLLSQSPDLPLPEGVDPAWIRECAVDLVSRGNHSLLLVGRRLPVSLQALALALNSALGSVGTTLLVQPRRATTSTTISQLAEKIRDGTVRTLIILGGDPVYNAPADLNWGALQSSIPNTLHLSPLSNATSKQSTWSIPGTHYLESWGDGLAIDGSYLSIQPMIQPLWNGQSQLQLLSRILALPSPIGPSLIRETFAQRTGLTAEKLEQGWNDFVREGFWITPSAAPTPRPANLNGVAGLLSQVANSPAEDPSSLEALFIQSAAVDDGRYANNGWMQEWPDPMTKLT